MRRPLLVLAALAGAIAFVPAQEPAKPLALLIGVTNYQDTGLSSLSYTVRDMQLLRDELTKQGYAVTLLANKDATKAGIAAALAKLIADRKPGQLLLLAVSGHGMQSRGADGKEDAIFCPFGCDKSEGESLVSLGELVAKLGNKGANLVLVDACRDDPKKSFSGNELQGKLPSRTAVLFSCSAGQASWETNKMYKGQPGFDAKLTPGHGAFMYHVLEGLKGAAKNGVGEVTWNGLAEYVTGRVNDSAKEWLDEYAQAKAVQGQVPLADLEFQTPHELRNMTRVPVLAHAAPAAAKPAPRPSPLIADGGDKSKEFDLGGEVKLKLVRIPAGKFWMGSPKGEADRNYGENDFDAEQQHEVEITKAFYMGVFTVTQEQYMAIMYKNPSRFTKDNGGGPDHPVEQVSWGDAKAFCKKLSDKTGVKFRLPTEAEWEYACRGGETGRDTKPFHFKSGATSSLDATMANFDGDYPYGGGAKGVNFEKTTRVGHFEPNRYGLYDMHGNVWQWCEDYYGPYGKLSATKDPIQLDKQVSERRVRRGGTWFSYGHYCRAASRSGVTPDDGGNDFGFRVCLPLD